MRGREQAGELQRSLGKVKAYPLLGDVSQHVDLQFFAGTSLLCYNIGMGFRGRLLVLGALLGGSLAAVLTKIVTSSLPDSAQVLAGCLAVSGFALIADGWGTATGRGHLEATIIDRTRWSVAQILLGAGLVFGAQCVTLVPTLLHAHKVWLLPVFVGLAFISVGLAICGQFLERRAAPGMWGQLFRSPFLNTEQE